MSEAHPPRPSPPPADSLLRNLGQFVGHIAHAVRTDPTAAPPAAESPAPTPAAVRTTVEERIAPGGSMILRRTTIDEIVPASDTRGSSTDA